MKFIKFVSLEENQAYPDAFIVIGKTNRKWHPSYFLFVQLPYTEWRDAFSAKNFKVEYAPCRPCWIGRVTMIDGKPYFNHHSWWRPLDWF